VYRRTPCAHMRNNNTHAHIHAQTYTQIMIHTRICTHAHTHTHTLQIQGLNPALPPDYYARILLGRQPGNKDAVERELKICLSREHVEVYCTLIEILRHMGDNPTQKQARIFLDKIESIGRLDMLNERKLVQMYAESTRRLLAKMVDGNHKKN
jgi:hypothetical protein